MFARFVFLSIFAAFAAACGSEIGDSCFAAADCDPNGLRTCDITSPGGYCTVVGCDFDTCPDEAVCVRFFVGSFENEVCDPATEDVPSSDGTDDCTLDEVCTIAGHCVPHAAEARYCMRKCGDDGDCRDGYECRTEELMIDHGGEPVLAPGERPDGDPQRFCAVQPTEL
jgi:hypothetical protein